jgi:tRNA dimethylallyltransferase
MSETLVVVVGPTGAGKSDLAVRLAQVLDGEVLSADSMQVYRHFDIGTAKVTPEEQGGIPHHLLDVADPDEHFSAARFVELADGVIDEIRRRGRRVILAGGTGLYVRALLRGLFEAPPADPEIRAEHARVRDEQGVPTLHAALQRVDPEAAARINENDFVRISRALEVHEQLGRPISTLQAEHRFATERYPSVRLGISPERGALRQRIDRRVDLMMAAGWLEEVRQLIAAGYGETAPMGALGYRHLHAHLQGTLDLDEAVRQTKRDTWRFARRQLNWFGADPGITWFEDGLQVEASQVAKRL